VAVSVGPTQDTVKGLLSLNHLKRKSQGSSMRGKRSKTDTMRRLVEQLAKLQQKTKLRGLCRCVPLSEDVYVNPDCSYWSICNVCHGEVPIRYIGKDGNLHFV